MKLPEHKAQMLHMEPEVFQFSGHQHRLTIPRCDSGREKPASTAHERVISGISILHCKFLLLFTKKPNKILTKERMFIILMLFVTNIESLVKF